MSSRLSPEQLQALPDFPPQSSSILNGQYAIKYTKEKSQAGNVNDDRVESKVWFQSQPLDLETIKRIDRLQLVAESHDQGWADDESAGNWTWLEVAIFESQMATAPRRKDGIDLVWISHPNHFKQEEYNWAWGAVFNSNHDLLRLLEKDNVIAVRLCARFPGWEIFAKNGYLVIDIGHEKEKKTIQYGQIVSEIKNIEAIINEVNLHTQPAEQFKPSLASGLYRADLMSTGGKRPLRVLSLDGGGARGLSSLYLLKAVMERVAPNKKPCEVFDMIGGTSTGGLIAIMLGRLNMSVQECIDEYNNVMAKVFIPKWDITKLGLAATKGEAYDSKVLETIIKDLVRKQLGSDDIQLLNERRDNTCKVFVMAVYEDAPNNRAPVYLRSYKNPYEDSLLPEVRSVLPEIKIWEAARATSAAPSYFKPITVGKYTLLDGGLGANNPLGWLWTEMLAIFGPARTTDCFLSIGTGIPKNEALKMDTGIIGAISSVATNTEITHILFRTLINAYAPATVTDKYWRLNVGKEIAEWDETHKHYFKKDTVEKHLDNYKDPGKMDDIKALPELIKMTNTYIKEQDAVIGQCAEKLRGSL